EGSFGSIWIYKGENFGRPMGEVSDWSAEVEAPVEVTAPMVSSEENAFDDRAGDIEGETDGESEPR
ncbi:MAG: hypothetical protein L0Z51_04385, partial [Candidatus Latescibacteria bacterium]|nr:hypothetical protein [Candidatus Latescibacterota bacterium]